MNTKNLSAEFIGTFTLVFIGVSSIVHSDSLLTIAIAHGLAVSIAVTCIGHISGGHINPAVTLGFVACGRMKIQEGVAYIVSQLLGGTVGAYTAKCLGPADVVAGLTSFGEGVTTTQAFGVEAVLTFLLVWTVFATAVDKKGAFSIVAGFAIGLTVAMDILAGGPLTGASMNPARTFGPALAHGDWANHWLYWVAPVVGSVIAAVAYTRLYLSEDGA